MSTLSKAKINRLNALKSTGPKTKQGKLIVATNATKHGILSKKLLLEGENPVEFVQLMEGLSQHLRPVGLLEMVLVEKIAINLWRQQRLIRAESASLDSHRGEFA